MKKSQSERSAENNTGLKKRNKGARFSPSSFDDGSENLIMYPQEDVQQATQLVEQEKQLEEKKKLSVLQRLSLIWTFISTGYMIAATVMFIAKDWIESTMTYILIGMLVAYAVVFIAFIVLAIKDAKSIKKKLKTYKKCLAIFKVFTNIALLILAATTMVGLAGGSGEPKQIAEWIMFGVTLLVAVIQFSLKVASLVMSGVAHGVAKHYKVKIERFKDGEKQKKRVLDKVEEKRYK